MKKKEKIIVSIIIPAYNEEKYIGQCIDSIKKQSFRNFEIIVVDDGSSDFTKEIVLKKGVRLFSLTHGGPGKAKNYGAKKARGKILVFVDADLILDKDYLIRLIHPILIGKSKSTYTEAEYVANIDNIWARCWQINSNLLSKKRIGSYNDHNKLAFRAIKKDIFFSMGGFDPLLGYNDDLTLGKSGLKIDKVKNAFCYHFNPDNLKDVFLASRWIGRSVQLRTQKNNLLKYSIFNSLRNSWKKIRSGSPFRFLFFKIIFDFGIIVGILFNNSKQNFAK